MSRRRSNAGTKRKSDCFQKSGDAKIYCICRSSDSSRFMIACDQCEEWYHGDCINITSTEADNIKRFFCHLCIRSNPTLKIEYKTNDMQIQSNILQNNQSIQFGSDKENDADLSSSSNYEKSSIYGKYSKQRKRLPLTNLPDKICRNLSSDNQDIYDEEETEDEIETIGLRKKVVKRPVVTDTSYYIDDSIKKKYTGRKFKNIDPSKGIISRESILTAAGKRAYKANVFSFEANNNMCVTELCHICARYSPTTSYLSRCPEDRCLGPPLGRQRNYGWFKDSDCETDIENPGFQYYRGNGRTYYLQKPRPRKKRASCSMVHNRAPRVASEINRRSPPRVASGINRRSPPRVNNSPPSRSKLYREKLSKSIKKEASIEVVNYRYGLEYEDHHYCRNHRSFDGHDGVLYPDFVSVKKEEVTVKTEPSVKQESTSYDSDPRVEDDHVRRTLVIDGRVKVESLVPVSPLPSSHSHTHHRNHDTHTDTIGSETQHSLASHQFYTIDDDDDLDINWP